MRKKSVKSILCMLLSYFIMFSLCSCSNNENEPENQIINYNITNEPVTLDPQVANDSGARLIIMNIFEGLVKVDANNSVIQGVAKEWSKSSDDTVYTFYLRDNACWNDGTPVTANDFVFGITRTFLPQTASSTAETLFCIKNAERVFNGELPSDNLGIKAVDDYTLVIELEYAYDEFLPLLATAPAMPCNQKFFEQTSGQYGRDDKMILSNGAFYVRNSSWEHNQYINLRKNPYYQGKDIPIPLGVNITIGETFDDICQKIQDGDIDCYSIPGNEISKAQKLGFNITSFNDTVWGIIFNLNDNIFKNKNIRLGLLSSLDRNFILKSLPDNCIESSDIISDTATIGGNSYRSVAGSNLCIKHNRNAKTILQKGITELKLDTLPSITILCTDDTEIQSTVNNIIETWNKLSGKYINKNPVPYSELNDYISYGNYQIVIAPLTVNGNNPLDTLELFYGNNNANIPNLSDSVYDNYINIIKQNPDSSSFDIMLTAEKYLNDNGIFYPLYTETRYYASAKNVTGVIFHPYGAEADFFYAIKITN